ncbi:NUDIX domain-containing protein [Pontivivens insulae]|uniref:Nucleoside triphosphatase NudI n=1 Tax=Pontivivens insulae TaxID=1639689 RepID=A0A2R8ACB7_9RHOB|nr:NUDIX domain-containing protein [Pontivivens insulae]RED11115.1 ADP-ribose pyrophosphatase YjhB (NUDIX family) [Pontivivens insulae]SPF29710.1 Nucleoside triphosphatase NudI [Pontivivens insulae]
MSGSFAETYLGRLRAEIGGRLLLVPGSRLVVRRDDGRILLQLRRDLEIWGLPGGCAEPGETLAEGAARELHEEAGLTVRPADLVPFAFSDTPETNEVTFPNGHRCHFFVLCFEVSCCEGHPIISDEESLALEWFAPTDLPEMLASSRATLDAHQRFRSTGKFQYG